MRRGIVDKKGEQFAYLEGDILFTIEGERSGRLGKSYIFDLANNKVWRVVGDGIYTLDGNQSIGFIMSAPKRQDW
ncbi:MAG: hypothetical protein AAF490_13605 [Chloroflexota bacterium]